MALLTRICLLALCLALIPTAAAAGAKTKGPKAKAVPTVANPARLAGSPKAKQRKQKRLSLGQRAAKIAARELGVPYRWGGSSPSGFDCSGLVSYVYGKLGVDLPHNAAAQYRYGRSVTQSRLKPGDLLFFSGLGHVGLYIGRGRMIHAPQSGRRVEIQRVGSRSGSLVGARRLRS